MHRPAAAPVRNRNHRDHPDGKRAPGDRIAGAFALAWHYHRDRRFRHRLLVARLTSRPCRSTSLKIDRGFVQAIYAPTKTTRKSSRTLISMAHSMKMKVVAEGVEEADQYKLLGQYEVDQIQGYLLSKPVDSAAIEAKPDPRPETARRSRRKRRAAAPLSPRLCGLRPANY